MKKVIAVLVLAIGFVSFASATIVAPALHTQKKFEIVKKQQIKKANVKDISSLTNTNSTVRLGQYALMGVLLVVLGALLFVGPLVNIIAATLIVLGVTLFVLDIIGII